MATETDDERQMDDVQSDTERKGRDRRNKKKFATKVIIRRLPPTMTEETFLKQIAPLPDNDYFMFVPADWSLGHFATSRAYISFVEQSDVFDFKDKFDGYVFVDTKGVEYPAIVEFAPFQSLPKAKSRKFDNKAGTIEEDPAYISFLASLSNADAEGGKPEAKMEYSYQIKDVKMITTTPLLEFLANKQGERRAERRRKNDDKRKYRDEEKSRKKGGGGGGGGVQLFSAETGDRKRRDGGKSRNKLHSHRGMMSGSIAEETAADADGIIVRTVKSRIMDRQQDRRQEHAGDGGGRDGGRDGGRQRKMQSDDGAAGGHHKDDKDAINRGRADASADGGGVGGGGGGNNGPRGENTRDANRRKDRRNRNRAERDARRSDAEPPSQPAERPNAELKLAKPLQTIQQSSVEEAPADLRPGREAASRKQPETRRERRLRAHQQYQIQQLHLQQQNQQHQHGDANRSGDRREPEAGPTKILTAVRPMPPPTTNKLADDGVALARNTRRASGDSSSGGDRSRDHSNAKLDRIRNKDRPTLQIYQPGRRRPFDADKADDGVSPGASLDGGGDKGPDFARPRPAEVHGPDAQAAAAATTTTSRPDKSSEKRVSRYSERRNKLREQQRKAKADGVEPVASLAHDLQTVVNLMEK